MQTDPPIFRAHMDWSESPHFFRQWGIRNCPLGQTRDRACYPF